MAVSEKQRPQYKSVAFTVYKRQHLRSVALDVVESVAIASIKFHAFEGNSHALAGNVAFVKDKNGHRE